jgi:hypothetical protein
VIIPGAGFSDAPDGMGRGEAGSGFASSQAALLPLGELS